jgi:hypothetical protein
LRCSFESRQQLVCVKMQGDTSAREHERARAISSCAAVVRYLCTSLRTVECCAPRYLVRARRDRPSCTCLGGAPVRRTARPARGDDVGLLPAAQVCITARYVKGGAPRRGGRGRVRIMCTLCACGASNESRAARSVNSPARSGRSETEPAELPPADQRAVLKLVDAMLDTRRRSTPPARAKRKAS